MRPLPFLLALLALRCSTEDATRPTSTIVDSAGVEIVFSVEPRWGDGGWTVSDRPLVDIGVVEGAEEYLLDNVWDARLVGDGGIVVANEGDNSIRRYDAEGRFLWRAGRSGDGPGEYRQLWFVRVMSGGRILGVQSRELWPDYVYYPDGEFLRAIDKPETPSGLVLLMRGDASTEELVLIDPETVGGTRLAMTASSFSPYSDNPWIRFPLALLDLESTTTDTVAHYARTGRRRQPLRLSGPERVPSRRLRDDDADGARGRVVGRAGPAHPDSPLG